MSKNNYLCLKTTHKTMIQDIQDGIAQNYVLYIIAPIYIWYFSFIVVVKFFTLRVF